MRKTWKLTREEVEAAIWDVAYVDRCCILTMSILHDKEKDPIGAVFGLVECASRLAAHLPEEKRLRVAERLRSAADRCEAYPAFEDAVRAPS